jgi:4'-phosphopantetheinyl transferase
MRLDGIGTDDQVLWEFLSAPEQERANRFYFDLHRQRFLRTHAFCRKILARYTHLPAAQLNLQALPDGKPYLVDTTGQDIRYNLSHSGDLMILAVTTRSDVGVDVEIHSAALDWRQIAAAYFESREVAALEHLEDKDQQLACFYRIWTMKEAYLKARGQGIAAGLRHTIVQTGNGLPAAFEALPGGENEMRRWQVFFFQPATGASGTVVIERGTVPHQVTRVDGTFIAQEHP